MKNCMIVMYMTEACLVMVQTQIFVKMNNPCTLWDHMSSQILVSDYPAQLYAS